MHASARGNPRRASITCRSFDDEFGGTIDNDVALLQAAIIGIAIYTIIAISNCRDGCVGGRVLLTIGGALRRVHAAPSCVCATRACHIARVARCGRCVLYGRRVVTAECARHVSFCMLARPGAREGTALQA